MTAITALAICCAVTPVVYAGNIRVVNLGNILTGDTIPVKPTLPAAGFLKTKNNTDSLPGKKDTVPVQRVDTFSLKISKDTLEAAVEYEAEDSAVVLALEKKIILYGKTKTTYRDVILTAPKVELDQQTNLLTAYNSVDSLGNVLIRARFEQADNRFESDTIQYNFKTQKGLTKNTFTQQNEIFIQGELIKKINASTVFVSRGRFTTCDLDEPHFAFRANKLKIVNNKVAISGPMHPEFEDVPIPLYLPFGYYPLSKGRHSGLLPPQFTSTENSGIGLEGLGYYKVLSDNFDLTVRGNFYSYGGWMINAIPTYRVRYRYSGSLSLELQHTKINFRGDPDFQLIKTFLIGWSHSVDPRARPGVTFHASVNAGSTKHNQYKTDGPRRNFQNSLNSSIGYSKNWRDKPFNLQLAANHSQNATTRAVNVELPTGSFSVNTIYPFQPKEAVGPGKWYEKIGIGYQGSFRNLFGFYDSAFSFQKLLDTMQWGVNHNIPISLTLPPMGPILVSPGITYSEQWIMSKRYLTWDPQAKKLDTTVNKGIYTARDISFSLSMNTALFGTYQFRNSKVVAIRHTIRPTVSINYKPNLGKKYFQTVRLDSANYFPRAYNKWPNVRPVNMYAGNVMGAGFGNQEFGGLAFGLGNDLQMKVRTKDSANPTKIIRLIEALSISSSYNFLADSLKLGDFQMTMSSSLFEKISISMNAGFTPYEVDDRGIQINKYVWDDGFRFGRMMNASVSMSTSFKSKPRNPSIKSDPKVTNPRISNDPAIMGDQERLLDYMRLNPSEFVDFNIPYDLSLSYSLGITKNFDPGIKKFVASTSSSLSFRNSFSLTPKWNFSTDGYVDLKSKQLQMLSIGINREMHCWQMSIGVTPVGRQRYFNISISPKSSLLQNLKVNRTRVFNDF